MESAPAEPDQLVDLRDGLEAFDPGARQSWLRIESAATHGVIPDIAPASLDDDGSMDVEWPSDETTALQDSGPEPEESSAELVWLADAADGLDAFDADAVRSLGRATVSARGAGTGAFTPSPPAPLPALGFSRYSWLRRAAPAAALCAVLSAFADGLLTPRSPGTPTTTAMAPAAVADALTAGDVLNAAAAVRPPSAPDSAAVAAAEVEPDAAPVAPRGERAPSVPPPSRTLGPGARSVRSPMTPPVRRAGAAPTVALPTSFASPGLAARDPAAEAPGAGAENTPAGEPRAVPVAPVAAVALAPPPSPPPALRFASTSVPPKAVGAPPGRELDVRAIENVLSRYRSAFNSLDAGAASAVWPSVNAKTLARAFERLEDQQVAFETCQIDVIVGFAEAACRGSARYVPRVGSRTPREGARQWRFNLRKTSGAWMIDRVDAR